MMNEDSLGLKVPVQHSVWSVRESSATPTVSEVAGCTITHSELQYIHVYIIHLSWLNHMLSYMFIEITNNQ